MSIVEAFLLALALCVDTLVVSAATALHSKMNYRHGLLMALVLGFCQFAFPLVGAIVGDVARSFIEAVDHWIAFALLAFIGGKMILDGIRGAEEDNAAPATHRSLLYTYFLLGIATSIDVFAVGIGMGLDNPMSTVLWVVVLIGVVTFLVSLLGIYLGKRNIPIPERTANIVAGIVLIGLGLKILIEHLFFQ
jgi:putative Mn2+ efflux pump MntP